MDKKYDLEERTALFAESIISLCKKIPENSITRRMISQIIGSGTSVAANYREANGASSKKDFRNKIYIVKKEIKETNLWLRLFEHYNPEYRGSIQPIKKESLELTKIFSRIISTLNSK